MSDCEALVVERYAQIAAHRACCGTEHDPANGKLHGYCVVCGVLWPCEYAGKPPTAERDAAPFSIVTADRVRDVLETHYIKDGDGCNCGCGIWHRDYQEWLEHVLVELEPRHAAK